MNRSSDNSPKSIPNNYKQVAEYRRPLRAKHTLLRLLGYAAAGKSLVIAAIICMLLSSAAAVYGAYFLKPLVNNYIVPYLGTSPTLAQLMPLFFNIGILAGIYIVGAVASYVQNRIMLQISQNILFSLRKELFAALAALPMSFFDRKGRGELMSRFTSDAESIKRAACDGLMQFLSSAITLSATFIMMILLSPMLTLIMAAAILLMYFVGRVLTNASAGHFRRQQAAVGELNSFVEERLQGAELFRLFGMESVDKQDFSEHNQGLCRAACNANTAGTLMLPVMGNLSYMNYIAIALAGALSVVRGYLDLGSLASYLQFTRSFANPITHIARQWADLMSALAGAERIFEIIDTEAESDEGEIAAVEAEEGLCWLLGEQLIPIRCDIAFEQVTFGYTEGSPVLRDFSLHIPCGRKFALIGSTGAGKSTVVNLLYRFYEPQSGRILLDGIDIRLISKSSLRSIMAVVLQEIQLFELSVEENILYGASEQHTDSAQAEACACLANADRFISLLPQGMQTVLAENGSSLSSGQRQLLSIARAACRQPQLLIFDEATAYVDSRTERLVEQGMDNLMEGKTVLLIAHRLSTVRHADCIVVLQEGGIAEQGNHEQLLAQQGIYYRLCTSAAELD